MSSLILSSFILLFAIVHTSTSSHTHSNQIKVARIPCDGLLTISDEDRLKSKSIKYSWKFRGMLINKICNKRNRSTISSYGDLLIENFGIQDHGTYYCEVELLTNGIRIVDGVQKKVDDSYVISDTECSRKHCVNAKKCKHSSSPKTCSGRGNICCEKSS